MHHAVEFGIYNDYNDKPMPKTVDPERVAAVAKHPSAYYGTKGTAVSGWWMNGARLFPESFMKEVGKPKAVLPRVKGHEADFLNAIRTGGRSSADFDYSARLTEIMLVGNVASRVREKLTYDFRDRQVHQQRQGQRPAETRAAQGLGIRIRIVRMLFSVFVCCTVGSYRSVQPTVAPGSRPSGTAAAFVACCRSRRANSVRQ